MYHKITAHKMLSTQLHLDKLQQYGMNHAEYIYLLSPALDWLMRSIAKNHASKETFQNILHSYRNNCNDAMVLQLIIDSFNGSYYSHATLGMVTLIKSATPSSSTILGILLYQSTNPMCV